MTTRERLTIDGSQGEGGGQIIRTSLALSALTGRRVQLTNIRAGRERPGLLRQHLTAVRAAADAVGLETRGPIYAGRPVLAAQLGPPAVVERNALVTLRYAVGTLVIETEGRALDRAAEDGRLRVMNLSSRMIVMGRAIAPGVVEVGR